MTVPAGYYDGRTTKRYPVILSISGGVASVEGPDVNRQEPLSSVDISDPVGMAPRIIRFVDGAFCEVTDVDELRRLLHGQGARHALVSQWETSWQWIAGAIVVFLAVLYGAYRFAIPLAAEAVAYSVPAAATEFLSRQVLEFLDEGLLTPSTLPKERLEQLSDAFRRLRRPASGTQQTYRIHFRKSAALGPNALALPSGIIIVTDELVELARDDREILGVLAHEAGHVDRRHGLRLMLQSSLVGLLVAWYIGDVSTIAAAAPTALIDAKYSRDLEREADAYAAALLRDNRIDVRYLADLLRRLDEKAHAEGVPDALRYLSSHPATEERLAELQGSQ